MKNVPTNTYVQVVVETLHLRTPKLHADQMFTTESLGDRMYWMQVVEYYSALIKEQSTISAST